MLTNDRVEQRRGRDGGAVEGSQLTDATCMTMLDVTKVSLLRTVFASLLCRYTAQAQLVHRRQVRDDGMVHVLDVGCSNGAAAVLYSSQTLETNGRKPIRYVGVDLHDASLAVARDVIVTSPSRVREVEVVRHDLTTPWPFEDDAFDVVWYTETIEHVPAEYATYTLLEAARVTTPGGVMLMSTPAPLGDELVWPDSHDHEFTREEARHMLESTGWQVDDVWGVNVNWTQARKTLRREHPEWFDIYERLRVRIGAGVARAAMQAVLPTICDDLAWLCTKE